MAPRVYIALFTLCLCGAYTPRARRRAPLVRRRASDDDALNLPASDEEMTLTAAQRQVPMLMWCPLSWLPAQYHASWSQHE